MKIRYVSDTHLEVSRDSFQIPEGEPGEILVLAGDICCMYDHVWCGVDRKYRFTEEFEKMFVRFIDDCCVKFKHVIMVLGNHDYWGYDVAKAQKHYQDLIGLKNFTLLTPKNFLELDDVSFIGCTLWTDIDGGDPLKMLMSERCMNDFHKIKTIGEFYEERFFRPSDQIILNKNEVAAMAQMINCVPKERKIVLVTHMAPFSESTNVKYIGDDMNCMFRNGKTFIDQRCGGIIKPFNRVKLWIHGHMHDPVDYIKQGIRVVANPRGYVVAQRVENPNFDPMRSVEI